jgi:benzoyl-CoA 2,3-dioxygenase component A
MNAPLPASVLKQHLIDPEICIRCNTCEETCPVDAITHDSNNYVVNADICNGCMACVPPCPTGSIDNWRLVPRARAYSVEAQLGWEELPGEMDLAAEAGAAGASAGDVGTDGIGTGHVGASGIGADAGTDARSNAAGATAFSDAASCEDGIGSAENIGSEGKNSEGKSTQNEPAAPAPVYVPPGATVPPWSAAHPYVNLYTQKNPIEATVVGNFRVTDEDTDSDIRHIVLDFGHLPFPVLEGQSIGIIAPGADARGRPHHPRQYSIASPRDGERPGYNNLSLTVKRVVAGQDSNTLDGVCSNYLCNLEKHDTVQVVGPFGNSFLMPDRPRPNLVMICTGTGSAPMRAMTERCRRRIESGENGRLMLFFGARTERELPYFGPLMKLPKDFIDINLALSRVPGQPKRYVQDLILERAGEVHALLSDGATCVYVCGLKGMEAGVLDALRQVAVQAGQDWTMLHEALRREGRLHFETY